MKKKQNVSNVLNKKVWVSSTQKHQGIDSNHKAADAVLWLISLAILVAGIIAASYISSYGSAYSATFSILIICILIAITRFTTSGRRFFSFFIASRLEMRQVTWPGRKETFSMAVMVMLVVVIASLMIYLVGMFFGYIIKIILG